MQTAAIEQARASDSDILQELNRNFIRSVQMSDVRWFDQNLSEDFLNSNGDGSLSERADFLVQIGRPCPVSNLCAEDVRIRILGEIAIVHGRTTYTKPDGRVGAGRYTDVYSRRQGGWVCVSADVTRG